MAYLLINLLGLEAIYTWIIPLSGINNSRNFCSIWCLSYVSLFVSAHLLLLSMLEFFSKPIVPHFLSTRSLYPFIFSLLHFLADLYPCPCLAPCILPLCIICLCLHSPCLHPLPHLHLTLLFFSKPICISVLYCVWPLYQSNGKLLFSRLSLDNPFRFYFEFFSRELLEIEFPSNLILKKEK